MRPIAEYFPTTLEPRRGQLEALQQIEHAFSVGKKYFVYEGPTGSGKSAVAKTVLNWLDTGFITTPLNTLVSQYANDKKLAPLPEVRGKSTYECRAFSRAGYIPNCEQAEAAAGWEHHAGRCSDYVPARDAFWCSKQSVTNLHFLYYSPVIQGAVWPRRVLVIDEAHKLEDALIGMGKRTISPRVVAQIKARLYEFPGKPDKELLEQAGVEKYLLYLEDALLRAVKDIDSEEEASRLENLREGINFTIQSGDWISWLTTNERLERILHISPLTAVRAAQRLFRNVDHVLFASATIGDDQLFLQGLGIKQEESGIFRAGCEFRPENRPVYFQPKGSMSTKCGRQGLEPILQACSDVLAAHPEERGIIHCHSREVQDLVFRRLESRFGARILTHGSKKDRDAGVIRLRNSRAGVLCSIAMAEGVDLADDAARFCIFPKIPWADLGDPFVKARMKRCPDWLSNKAALDLVQGSGRVVRHAEDYGETYIFDSSFGRLLREATFPQWWLDALAMGKKPSVSQGQQSETVVVVQSVS